MTYEYDVRVGDEAEARKLALAQVGEGKRVGDCELSTIHRCIKQWRRRDMRSFGR